jgi:lysophospholipase L1-like esterase
VSPRGRVLGVILGVALLFVVANVARTAIAAAAMSGYWQARMREPVASDAFRLVALGDSSAMGVGADRPTEGFVGRIATYVEERTGRPVHITNVSVGGATGADLLRHQLPQVDLRTADLVIVAHSADLTGGSGLDAYRAALETLVARLPSDRTIYSDVPLLPGWEPYQATLAQLTDTAGILRADFAAVFGGEGRRLDIFSWLPPHLNSRGCWYWFRAFQPQVDVILERIAAGERAET